MRKNIRSIDNIRIICLKKIICFSGLTGCGLIDEAIFSDISASRSPVIENSLREISSLPRIKERWHVSKKRADQSRAKCERRAKMWFFHDEWIKKSTTACTRTHTRIHTQPRRFTHRDGGQRTAGEEAHFPSPFTSWTSSRSPGWL